MFNVLLQVLDDGRITDSQGRTVDFKNTIIILTSNPGSSAILEGIDENGNITEAARKQVEGMLKTQFRPEFLNRLDEIVFYKPLTRSEIDKIVDLQVADLNRRLSDKQLTMRLTPAARSYIVAQGYDPIYGARPLKRFMQRSVETLIARKLIAEECSRAPICWWIMMAISWSLTPSRNARYPKTQSKKTVFRAESRLFLLRLGQANRPRKRALMLYSRGRR